MPFALVTIGLIMIVTGARDTYKQFGAQVTQDFVGSGGFLYWIAAIGAVGALGYIPQFRTFSRAFLALIIVAMILRNGGFFTQFQNALKQGPTNIQSDTQANGTTGGNAASSDPLLSISGVKSGSYLDNLNTAASNFLGSNSTNKFDNTTNLFKSVFGF